MQAARQTSRNTLRGRARKATLDVSDADRSLPRHGDMDTPAPAAAAPGPSTPEPSVPTPSTPDPATPDPSILAVSPQPPVSAELVQASLVAALQSREFRSAPQLRSFLGFVVRATLNDEQEKLKGYTIAVEALGRPEDFNPVTDPIVRVEAARLRRRLEKYYAGSGAGDPVRIVIPKGSYAPEFRTICPKPAAEQAPEAMRGFAEDGTDYRPPAAPLPAQDNARAPVADPDPARSAPPEPGAPSAGAQPATSLAEGLRPQLLNRPVSLPLAVCVAVFCFFAGYLAGTL